MCATDFPGGPVVKTSPSNAGGAGSISSQGAKISHALQPKNQNVNNRSGGVTNSIKTLKTIHIKKNLENICARQASFRHGLWWLWALSSVVTNQHCRINPVSLNRSTYKTELMEMLWSEARRNRTHYFPKISGSVLAKSVFAMTLLRVKCHK